jgi:hypothetical protein
MKLNLLAGLLILAVVASFAMPVAAQRLPSRSQLVVPVGTAVQLIFDQNLSSKTARVGDRVRLHAANSIMVGGLTVLKRGAPVLGVVSKVEKRKHFGVNAQLRLALNPVRSTYGTLIPLQPRTQGSAVGGEKSAKAGGAAAGGAIVLGPVGLIGGYFVSGKPVIIKAGDRFATEVAKTVVIRLR